MASLHSVGIWFIHERCRVALDFFYYVVMHSAFISDELIPWTFFLLCCNALCFYFRWSYALYFVNYPKTVVVLFVSLKRLLVLLQSLKGLQVLLQSLKGVLVYLKTH